tara:strand:- start:219 stop:737 length:519 start_codon:yes stop_codon:yes gene_type:complete
MKLNRKSLRRLIESVINESARGLEPEITKVFDGASVEMNVEEGQPGKYEIELNDASVRGGDGADPLTIELDLVFNASIQEGLIFTDFEKLKDARNALKLDSIGEHRSRHPVNVINKLLYKVPAFKGSVSELASVGHNKFGVSIEILDNPADSSSFIVKARAMVDIDVYDLDL